MKTRFAVFYFLLFFPIGASAPYLILFFDRKGFTDPQLGTLAAVITGSRRLFDDRQRLCLERLRGN